MGGLAMAYLRLLVLDPGSAEAIREPHLKYLITLASFATSVTFLGYEISQVLTIADLWEQKAAAKMRLDRGRNYLSRMTQRLLQNGFYRWREFLQSRTARCSALEPSNTAMGATVASNVAATSGPISSERALDDAAAAPYAAARRREQLPAELRAKYGQLHWKPESSSEHNAPASVYKSLVPTLNSRGRLNQAEQSVSEALEQMEVPLQAAEQQAETAASIWAITEEALESVEPASGKTILDDAAVSLSVESWRRRLVGLRASQDPLYYSEVPSAPVSLVPAHSRLAASIRRTSMSNFGHKVSLPRSKSHRVGELSQAASAARVGQYLGEPRANESTNVSPPDTLHTEDARLALSIRRRASNSGGLADDAQLAAAIALWRRRNSLPISGDGSAGRGEAVSSAATVSDELPFGIDRKSTSPSALGALHLATRTSGRRRFSLNFDIGAFLAGARSDARCSDGERSERATGKHGGIAGPTRSSVEAAEEQVTAKLPLPPPSTLRHPESTSRSRRFSLNVAVRALLAGARSDTDDESETYTTKGGGISGFVANTLLQRSSRRSRRAENSRRSAATVGEEALASLRIIWDKRTRTARLCIVFLVCSRASSRFCGEAPDFAGVEQALRPESSKPTPTQLRAAECPADSKSMRWM